MAGAGDGASGGQAKGRLRQQSGRQRRVAPFYRAGGTCPARQPARNPARPVRAGLKVGGRPHGSPAPGG